MILPKTFKLPVRFDGHGINDADGIRIIKLAHLDLRNGFPPGWNEENQFIVKAINDHAEMLSLLRASIDDLDQDTESMRKYATSDEEAESAVIRAKRNERIRDFL